MKIMSLSAKDIWFVRKPRPCSSSSADLCWKAGIMDADPEDKDRIVTRPAVVDLPRSLVFGVKESPSSSGKMSLLLRCPREFVDLVGEIEERCLHNLRGLHNERQAEVLAVTGPNDDVDDLFRSRLVRHRLQDSPGRHVDLLRVDLVTSNMTSSEILDAASLSGTVQFLGAATVHGRKGFALSIELIDIELSSSSSFEDLEDLACTTEDEVTDEDDVGPDPDEIEGIQSDIQSDLSRIADAYQERLGRVGAISARVKLSTKVDDLERIREEVEALVVA